MSARCCYFLQTHRDPEQVYRLVRTLRRGSPRAVIVVQHNFGAGPLDWEPLAAMADVHLLRLPYPQLRGSWSCQVQPTLDAIAWLEREGIGYDWLVTLTGQDYPVMPLPASERQLRESGSDAFLRHWEIHSPASPWPLHKPRRRYFYRYRRLAGRERLLRLLRPLSRLVSGVHISLFYGPYAGVRAWWTPFRGGFRCYGGWAWGALRREAARFVIAELAAKPALLELYRHTMSPEESILQTLLCNSGRFRLDDDDRRYLDYTGTTTGSPRTLGVADLPVLASGRYWFARKFDPGVDLAVLDRIDGELLGGAG